MTDGASDITVGVVTETIKVPLADSKLNVTLKQEQLNVQPSDSQVKVALKQENINIHPSDPQINVTLNQERLSISPAAVLGVPTGCDCEGGGDGEGWPFGANPLEVTGLTRNVATVVDSVAIPNVYRVVKWMFSLLDDTNSLEITSEVKCIRKGDMVTWMEFGIIGDSTEIEYDVGFVLNGANVDLVITSRYDGILTIRMLRIGIFN